MDRISLDGQVAIVTGGGRNLGRAYCLELARRGAAVVVNDLPGDEDVAAEVVARIEADGGRAAVSHDSVAEPDGAQGIVRTALDAFGTIDIVVNNAGVMRNAHFEDISPAQLDLVLAVNLRGVFLVTQAAWPTLAAKGYGRVVMASSASIFSGITNYAASKAGVYGLTRALAVEGEGAGIRVNAILPRGGAMHSVDTRVPDLMGEDPDGLRERLRPRTSPTAPAALVAYLASGNCSVTGQAFSASYGAYQRVFLGLTPGWAAPDAEAVTAEDIVEHFDEICDLDGFSVPFSQYDEVRSLARAVEGVP